MRRQLLRVGNFVLVGFLLLGTTACGGEMATAPMIAPQAERSEGKPAEYDPFNSRLSDSTATTGSSSESALLPQMSVVGTSVPAASGPTSGHTEERLSTGITAPQSTYQSPLTAGQVDDNARFDEYIDYLRNSLWIIAERINVEQRLFVRVLDSAQQPVAGARVQLFDGDRRVFDGLTVSDGRVLFFPRQADAFQAKNLRALITRGSQQVDANLRTDMPEQTASITLPDNTGPVALDIVFLMDATGSMNDEIEQLKATVGTIASRIEQLPGSSKPRLGLVAYRDRGDEYVTRSWDFTSDVQQFSANLANVRAADGGDYPEAVNAGLHDAIHLPGWADTSSGRHLRMIVLVGDAPPHLDYADDYEYTNLLEEAVAAGIKIFPIGASSLDDTGEYIFRQFAQVTQGQFIFLTYDNGVSGAPGPSTDKHVSNFTVRNLDSLVVNLVAGETANQTGQKVEVSNPVPVVPSPVDPAPVGWVERLDSMLKGAVDQLTNANLALWIAALLGTFFLTRKASSEKARVAALPEPHDTSEEDLISEREARRRMEREGEIYSNLTVRVAPRAGVRAIPQGGEPTLPLGSLPPGFRHYSLEETAGVLARQTD